MKHAARALLTVLFATTSLTVSAATPASAATSFYLPYTAGITWLVSQGNGGSTSHGCGSGSVNCYAYDFAGNRDQPILASAPGTIRSIVRNVDGQSQALGYGNVVVLQHSDGTCTRYAHMRFGSVTVKSVGAEIGQGEQLGLVGNTGYTLPIGSGYHLHWQRETCSNGRSMQTGFVETLDTVLQQGQRYTSQNPPGGQTEPDSDGDGVPDASDSCPSKAGPAWNRGCPLTIAPIVPLQRSDGSVELFAINSRISTADPNVFHVEQGPDGTWNGQSWGSMSGYITNISGVSYPVGSLPLIDAAYADFLGRAPTAAQKAQASAAIGSTGSGKAAFLRGLASSTEWTSSIVNGLYRDTLGRDGDAGGVAYWSDQIRAGRLTVAQVAANFYGSSEYFRGIGGNTIDSWVRDLYANLLGRTPDAGGVAYWSGEVGRRGRVNVAFRLFQSSESAHRRVANLYQKLLGRRPDQGGWDYWAAQVVAKGDISLALNLAASEEYRTRALVRFPNRHLELFGVNTRIPGTTANAFHRTYTTTAGWSEWEQLPTTWLSSIAPVLRSDGKVELFGINNEIATSNPNVFHIEQGAAGTWAGQSWTGMSGYITAISGIGYSNRGIELFGVNTRIPGTTANAFHRTYTTAAGWSEWEQLPTTWLSSIAPVLRSDGKVELFGINNEIATSNPNVFHIEQGAAGTWAGQSWTGMSGYITAISGIGYSNRGIELFGVNTRIPSDTSNVFRRTYSSGTGWTEWVPLPQAWLG